MLGQIADWVHLVAAMLWVGGVLTLALVVWPLAPDSAATAFLRFSRIAVVLIGGAPLRGHVRRDPAAARALRPLGHLVRAHAARQDRRSCSSRSPGAGSITPSSGRGSSAATLLGVGRSLLGESAVAMAVLLAAAVLVNGAPPPVEPDAGKAARTECRVDAH